MSKGVIGDTIHSLDYQPLRKLAHFLCDAHHSPPVESNDTNTCLALGQDIALLAPGCEGAYPSFNGDFAEE